MSQLVNLIRSKEPFETGPKLPRSHRRTKAERTQHIPGYTSTSDAAKPKSTCPFCQAWLLRASCLTAPGLDWCWAVVGRQSVGGCLVEQLCTSSLHPDVAGNHLLHPDLRGAQLIRRLCFAWCSSYPQTHFYHRAARHRCGCYPWHSPSPCDTDGLNSSLTGTFAHIGINPDIAT